ncbi:MAG: argininosuccinate synthase [Methanomicrobiaceae archaeon]|nr:argininosuccinate synthase [Methanomicrobiaceae archaeon]
MMSALLKVCCLFLILAAFASSPAMGATGEVRVVKYASDASTILAETTVDVAWMEANLPVLGDGATHYYFQGPVFEDAWDDLHPGEPYDPWNPDEDVNCVPNKDLGAVKGTNVADLCTLVGGMDEGDIVVIRSEDGFSKRFPYENVYDPDPRQGPMGLTWYTTGSEESGQYSGYAPDEYLTGMRLVMFADGSTNPYGAHVFGVWDMHECVAEEYWHYYYQSQTDRYPSTGGFTVKYVSEVAIIEGEAADEASSPASPGPGVVAVIVAAGAGTWLAWARRD